MSKTSPSGGVFDYARKRVMEEVGNRPLLAANFWEKVKVLY